MAFSTNIGSNGPPDGGLLETSGTSVRQVCLDLRDMIVNDSESRWVEVTSSDPTPSHLQSFASTINSGNVGDNTYGFDQHVTLYLNDDNSLSFSEPGARLLRLSAANGASGIYASVLDTTRVDNTQVTESDWVTASSQPDSFGTIFDEHDSFWLNDDLSSGYDKANDGASLQQDFKFFYVIDNNFLWMNAYAPNKTDDFIYGGAAFYYPDPPSNGTVNREDSAFIFFLEDFYVHSADSGVWKPNDEKSAVRKFAYTKAFLTPAATDYQDRNIYSEAWVVSNSYGQPSFFFDSFIPHTRFVNNGVYEFFGYDFPTFDLNGDGYFIAGGHDNSDTLVALRYN